MDWVKQTFWYVDVESGARKAVVVDPGDEYTLKGIVDLTPAAEMEPCKDCPHLTPCMSSLWNEGRRSGGPVRSEGTALSFTHTCLICGLKVFTCLGPDTDVTDVRVPNACPRWDAHAGSALECLKCRNARDAWEAKNPKHQRQLEAAGKFLKAVFGQPKEEVPTAEIAAAFVTRVPEASPEATAQAMKTLGQLVESIQSQFPTAWEGLERDRESLFLLEWIDEFVQSQARDEPPAAQVQGFLYSFLRFPEMSRAWVACPIPERKFTLRVWEGLVRRSQAGG